MSEARANSSVRAESVAVGTGLVVLDLVTYESRQIPAQAYAGGTCGNVLSILAILGWSSWPAARVGDDRAADIIVEDLESRGAHIELIIREPKISSAVILEKIRPGGIPSRTHTFSLRCPVCGSYFPPYRPLKKDTAEMVTQMLKKTDVFFFDRVSRSALALAEFYRTSGSLIVFEPSSISSRGLYEKALGYAHVVKYSRDRMGDLADTVDKCKVPLEIETLGPEGLRYRSNLPGGENRRWTHVPAFRVSGLVDEAGSGDWCTAGLIDGAGGAGANSFLALSERDLRHSLDWGQALAAINCSFPGALGASRCLSREMLLSMAKKMMAGNTERTTETPKTLSSKIGTMQEICRICKGDIKRSAKLSEAY